MALSPLAVKDGAATDYLVIRNTNAGNLSAGTLLAYTIEWCEDDS